MEKKNGFTLMQFAGLLFVVCVIYFILIPKYRQIVENSKRSMFETTVKDVYNAAVESYVLGTKADITIFSNSEKNGTSLSRMDRKKVSYSVYMMGSGKVKKIVVTDARYSFEAVSDAAIELDDIGNKYKSKKASENIELYLDSDGKIKGRLIDPEENKKY